MRKVTITALIILSIILTGCHGGPEKALRKDPSVLAIAGRYYLDKSDFESALEYNQAKKTEDNNVKSRILDSMIDQVLILNDSESTPKPSDPRPLGFYAEAAVRERTVSEVLERKVYSRVKVPQTEIEDYYKSHMQDYTKGEGVQIRGILVRSRKEADEVARLLRGRHSFVSVARLYSLSPEKGEKRYFEYSELPSYIVNVIKGAKPGIPTKPFEVSSEYYQILLVEKRFKSYTVPLEEVKPRIRLLLSDKRSAELQRAYLKELKERFKVVVFWSKLGFEYRKETT